MAWLPMVKKLKNMFIRFNRIYESMCYLWTNEDERDRQMDRRTDGRTDGWTPRDGIGRAYA